MTTLILLSFGTFNEFVSSAHLALYLLIFEPSQSPKGPDPLLYSKEFTVPSWKLDALPPDLVRKNYFTFGALLALG
jgi:hypothetical protein